MDRREFCKKIGLVSASLGITDEEKEQDIKSCESCRRWELKPGDIIVIECSSYFMSDDYIKRTREALSSTFPDNDILILDGSTELKIIHKETS